MSNIIDFLERMGQDAKLRHANDEELNRAFANAGIAADVRRAILLKSDSELELLTGARPNICCAIFPVEDDESEGGTER